MILYPYTTEYPAFSNAIRLLQSEKVLKMHFPAYWKLKNQILPPPLPPVSPKGALLRDSKLGKH